MALEIERKFLVKGDYKIFSYKSDQIAQGYLSSVPERTVRVRIKGSEAFLTIKGIGSNSGLSRYEWEKEITVSDARDLMKLCEPNSVIDKVRHYISAGKHIFEVDEFFGDNEGLVVAEIELLSEDEDFISPEWLGEEVTNNSAYYNASLSKHPFTKW